MTMRLRRTLLASAAAAGLLALSSSPAGAFSEDYWLALIYEFVATYLVPILDAMAPMPSTLDGNVLAGTQRPIGEDPGSYVTRTGPGRFDALFPDRGNPEWFPPDGASAYAALREAGRKARVNEAMDEAARVTADQEAAAARLDGYAARNGELTESLAGLLHLGNQVGIETAGSLKELTALTAETAQLEADQRLQEDWQRRQQDAYLHASLANGYWAGVRTWQPNSLAAGR